MSPVRKSVSRRRICFPLIGGTVWMGGMNYLNTLLHVVTHELADFYSACLLVAPDEADLAREKFGTLDGVDIVVDRRVAGAGSGRRAVAALATGRDAAFAELVLEQGAALVFENARFYGHQFPVPVLAWLPDFQHRYLRDMFSAAAWWRREIGFRAQCAGGREILLSSHTAEKDCHRFYPRSAGHTHVARFTATLDIPSTLERSKQIRAAYRLPASFMFIPNQFWVHKNHRVVIESLKLL